MLRYQMFWIFASVLILVFAVILFARGRVTVPAGQVMVLERAGQFKQILSEGGHWILPLADQPRTVVWPGGGTRAALPLMEWGSNVRTPIISKDNGLLDTEIVLWFELTDPVKAAYDVPDLNEAVEQIIKISARNAAAEITWKELLTVKNATTEKWVNQALREKSEWTAEEAKDWAVQNVPSARQEMQETLTSVLRPALAEWGLSVNRVEILMLLPSPELAEKITNELQRKNSDAQI